MELTPELYEKLGKMKTDELKTETHKYSENIRQFIAGLIEGRKEKDE